MKSKTKPKQDSYVVLQRWMRTELGLKGNELTVYAIIYGFSQDGESVYKGGYGYLADWTGLSENGARNIVKELVAKGLLKELKTMVGGILVNQYVAVRNPVLETVPEDGTDPYKNCTPTKNVSEPLQKVYPDPYKKCRQEIYRETYRETYLSARGAQNGYDGWIGYRTRGCLGTIPGAAGTGHAGAPVRA